MSMTIENMAELKEVTVIYYCDDSLELKHEIKTFTKMASGRVVIPVAFKFGKSIIAVCEGSVNILNSIGERINSIHQIEEVG